MYLGPCRFSLPKRIAARTSVWRAVRSSLGLRAPAGWGSVTNPRRAAFNRVYRGRQRVWRRIAPVIAVGMLWLVVELQSVPLPVWCAIGATIAVAWFLQLLVRRRPALERMADEESR